MYHRTARVGQEGKDKMQSSRRGAVIEAIGESLRRGCLQGLMGLLYFPVFLFGFIGFIGFMATGPSFQSRIVGSWVYFTLAFGFWTVSWAVRKGIAKGKERAAMRKLKEEMETEEASTADDA